MHNILNEKIIKNQDDKTVNDFGDEWTQYKQEELTPEQLKYQFDWYFEIFNWDKLPENAVGFDIGCGSGRWAKLVAPKVGKLNCIDASVSALKVARENLSELDNCTLIQASFESIPLDDDSMDFGYSLGVLHHIPDTQAGIKECVKKLKPGAPFLAYIYYAFDNRPVWFKIIWRLSDIVRRVICKLPFNIKLFISKLIAIFIYFPLSRLAGIFEKVGVNVDNFPLSAYRNCSFYSLKTDALDRFGTRLEKRFTLQQIENMFEEAGLENISHSDSVPYWCVIGYKNK